MSAHVESTQRFLRPSDLGRLRRNQRRIQLLRIAVAARNILFALAVVAGALSIYRHTQSDTRFAVKNIEFTGAVHTQAAAVQAITGRYVGLNLFKIDIARVQRDFGSLPWIQRISIEKHLPDTLRIRIVERTPAALVRTDSGIRYVDASGVTLGALSPTVGDRDLPLIADASGSELLRTLDLLAALQQRDPVLYSRIGEIRPVPPRGFSIFDRELGAFVYANSDDISAQWRTLYSIVQSEQLTRGAIEYADLRFAGRVVVKPVRPIAAIPAATQTNPATQITN